MIKYALACTRGHEFEAWFRSSAAYEKQAARRLVTCPQCGSNGVEKRPMAPAVVKNRGSGASRPATPAEPAASPPKVPATELLRAYKQHIMSHTEDVGSRFADEALRMHYGEAEQRGIRGETTHDEALQLQEEGVAFGVLPSLPEEQN